MACKDGIVVNLGGQEISRNLPLPLVNNPCRHICTIQFSLSFHHRHFPSLSFMTTASKLISAISYSLSNSWSLSLNSSQMGGFEFRTEGKEATEMDSSVYGKRKIFVAGANGSTGKRIVEKLLAKGFRVKAGVRDLDKAKTNLPQHNPHLQIVKADVTEGSAKLEEAISDDSEAVICATGSRSGRDLYYPWKVDNLGTVNLVDACRKLSVNRFILISSILVNGAAMGQILNPAYIFLNVFGLTLIAKLRAENYVRESGINYTIIRPGGLRNDPPIGNLVMEPQDTLSQGTISRDMVAEVAIEALLHPEASYKVVEIVSRADALKSSFKNLFSSVSKRGPSEF